MPINSLWMLRKKIDAVLASKLISEKEELEQRLARVTEQNQKLRRPYPKVYPNYATALDLRKRAGTSTVAR
jgi:hypothetical protein